MSLWLLFRVKCFKSSEGVLFGVKDQMLISKGEIIILSAKHLAAIITAALKGQTNSYATEGSPTAHKFEK